MKTVKIGYAITGIYGLYAGWHRLRKDMIWQHCHELGSTWKECKKRGDKAVKITITELK